MSMLAEPRRKQRIGPNPRGKFFTEDEDNRGRNMLQKMGWKHGDGLGVERQGITEPIKPKIQNDSKGLGFDIKTDAWVAHNDDFNAVLKNLQEANGGIVQEEEELEKPVMGFGFKEEPKSESVDHIDLEKKSKSSRSRIHYHKFVKNKDLSKIKKEDWGAIFGKSAEEVGDSGEIKVKQEKVEECIETKDDNNASELFINRGSLQDYFKAKRAKSFVKAGPVPEDSNPVEDAKPNEIKNRDQEYDEAHEREVQERLWKEWKTENDCDRSESKNKLEIENRVIVEEEKDSEGESSKINQVEPSKKKKKDRKSKEKSNEVENDSIVEESVQPNSDFEGAPKKKKKNRKSKTEEDSVEIAQQNNEIEESPKKKMKKKDGNASNEDSVDSGVVLEGSSQTNNDIEEPSKKKKRDRKRKDEESAASSLIGVVEDVGNFEPSNENEEPLKKKKKDRKRKKETVDVENSLTVEESVEPQLDNEMEDPPKKKKKSRKSKVEESVVEEIVEPSIEKQEPKKKKKDKKAKGEDLTVQEMSEAPKNNAVVEQESDVKSVEKTTEIIDSKPSEKFINCGSMEDYFKAKMAAFYAKSEAKVVPILDTKVDPTPETKVALNEAENENVVTSDKEKRKKKRKKAADAEDTGNEEPLEKHIQSNSVIPSPFCLEEHESLETTDVPKKKKKKKDKKEKTDEISIAPAFLEDASSSITGEDSSDSKGAIEDSAADGPKEPGLIKGNLNKLALSAQDYHEAAKKFAGSNLLKIPGYRNQSNKTL